MDSSKLLHGFVKIAKRICLCCYMDVSKMFYVFLALCPPKKAEVLPRFQSLLKLLLWNKVVESTQFLGFVVPLATFVIESVWQHSSVGMKQLEGWDVPLSQGLSWKLVPLSQGLSTGQPALRERSAVLAHCTERPKEIYSKEEWKQTPAYYST